MSPSASVATPPVPSQSKAEKHVRVVGELACQRDSSIDMVESIVVSCTRVTSSTQSGSKKSGEKSKKSSAATKASEEISVPELWEVECEDSVLFPEGTLTDHVSLLFAWASHYDIKG